jgi:hypothetical protein
MSARGMLSEGRRERLPANGPSVFPTMYRLGLPDAYGPGDEPFAEIMLVHTRKAPLTIQAICDEMQITGED